MADDYKYDAFISYSHKDEDWVVNTLLPALENAGMKVCIDFRDFTRGAPSVKELENAILSSRKTLMVLSPDYLASKWTDFEVTLGQTLSPANQDLRLLPLLREKCDLPLRISYMTYIDFVRKDREGLAWKQLFTALGKPDAPIPTTAPEEPKAENSPDWHLAHPYPMPPNFTGRKTEREMLTNWLQNDTQNRLFILCALGGFGKSALAWHWLTHDVSAKEWPKIVWWSFYEGDASFENFIKETLEYLNVEVPPGQRQQVDELLKAMQSQKILLIMDGFERALRAYSSMNAAYQGDSELPSPLGGGAGGGVRGEIQTNQRDCVNLNAEIFLKNLCVLPNIKGKVLVTTRLTPRAVEQRGEIVAGCHEVELQAIQKEDAIAFFRAQGIRGGRAEIEAACQPYGYHPLSLRILAGLIANDREIPGDIAIAEKLDLTDDVVQNKHHVLEVAYNTLSPEQQKLLSHIACFRSAMTYDALKAIDEDRGESETRPYEGLDAGLKTLEHRGLLHWDKRANKYDLHPIVRRYAYERLTAPDRIAAHTRLQDYFAFVPELDTVEKLEDLAPVIELYYHTALAGELNEAIELFRDRISRTTYYQLSAYQLRIELLRILFVDGEDKLPRLKNKLWQAYTLGLLANSYSMSGQPRRAVPLWEMAIKMLEQKGPIGDLAVCLGSSASITFLPIGMLHAAELNQRSSIKLAQEIQHEGVESIGHAELGQVQIYCGEWNEAEQELRAGEKVFDKYGTGETNFGSVVRSYRSLRTLLMMRDPSQSKTIRQKTAFHFAQRALELAEERIRTSFPVERDFIRAYWLLGTTNLFDGQLALAELNLSEALTRCRSINLVEAEAAILLELAKLRYAQEKPKEVKSLTEEALLITERSGYVLQGADVHLFLAQFALEQEKDKEKAKELAERAKELATCDGPPYYYKVAYEEAERFLEKL